MRPYQTLDKLEEKIYTIHSNDEIERQIKTFLDEVISRKRFDPFEEGLQAGGVIYYDKAGFKICENDGMAPHSHTFETLSQYLNGERKFSGINTMGNYGARRGDVNSFLNIPHNGFTVRVLAGEYEFTIIFETNSNNISSFQLNIIKTMISYVKEIKKQGIVVTINFLTRENRFLMKNSESDDPLSELEQIINSSVTR